MWNRSVSRSSNDTYGLSFRLNLSFTGVLYSSAASGPGRLFLSCVARTLSHETRRLSWDHEDPGKFKVNEDAESRTLSFKLKNDPVPL